MLLGKKYILVAGGAGFIGSHLVEKLIDEGCAVDVLDNFFTGNVENLRTLIERMKANKDNSLRIMSHDIVTLQQDPAVDQQSNYDVIYNLACPASPKKYQADPVGTMMTCVVGTTNLLALAEAHNAIFVQASTSEVYGDPTQHPQKESYKGNVNPYGPRAMYDEGKRAAESMCYVYREKGLDVRVARIFNTYGPRMDPDDGRVVSTFVRQALDGEPLTVFGEGLQTRSFCYVSDLVNALISLANKETYTHGPVNIGNDGEFKIIELVELLSEWFPRIMCINEPLPQDDPMVRKPDLTLAKATLGYEPTVQLRDGIKMTIDWMKQHKSKT